MMRQIEKLLFIIGAGIVAIAAVGGIIILIGLAVLISPQTVRAEEAAIAPAKAEVVLPFNKVMLTDVGKIVLETAGCPTQNKHGFIYKAYATDDAAQTGQPAVHEGCWYRDHQVITIWFYNEKPPLIANYHEHYFKDPEAAELHGMADRVEPQ